MLDSPSQPSSLEAGDAAQSGSDVAVRRADHGHGADQKAVLALLEQHLGTGPQAAAARYRWLYLDNPHGQAVTFLAESPRGEALGLTSLFPRKVQVAGRQLLGAIGGDGFVCPAYRRRGIATRIHQAALAGMAEAEVEFMYGPPEINNLRALRHAGSTIVGRVERSSRLLCLPSDDGVGLWTTAIQTAAAWVLRPRRADLEVIELGPRPDPRVDDVCAAMLTLEAREVLPVRDAAYYAWRFGASPAGRQSALLLRDGSRPIGVAAVERHAGCAAIVDLGCLPGARLRALRALLHACRDMERVSIQIHVPALAWQRDLLRLGFIPRERKLFQVQVRPDHPDRLLLLRPAAWHYFWGDGDVDHVL